MNPTMTYISYIRPCSNDCISQVMIIWQELTERRLAGSICFRNSPAIGNQVRTIITFHLHFSKYVVKDLHNLGICL